MVIVPSQGLKRALIRGGIAKMKIWKGLVLSILKLKETTVDIEIKGSGL